MVDYPYWRTGERSVRAMGVKPFYKALYPNGVTAPGIIATVYSDASYGWRLALVFYKGRTRRRRQ